MTEEEKWTPIFRGWLLEQKESDPAHDLPHIERVVANSRILCHDEGADWNIIHPSAWLHDCVFVAKDSPDRAKASTLSADHAVRLLDNSTYQKHQLEAIHHAISAHSFSANIETKSLEAMVLQDADRLDALGAFGLSRCLMLGGHMESQLYHSNDPFCENRSPDDARFCVDHFFAKLLTLKDTMQTEAGKTVAIERTKFLKDFLDQLKDEISP